jgi:hypothetical protein
VIWRSTTRAAGPLTLKGRHRQHLGESAQTQFQLLVPILVSQHVHELAQCLGCTHSTPRCTRSTPQGFTIPEVVVRPEANSACNERLQVRR